jgi:hypothetical protein
MRTFGRHISARLVGAPTLSAMSMIRVAIRAPSSGGSPPVRAQIGTCQRASCPIRVRTAWLSKKRVASRRVSARSCSRSPVTVIEGSPSGAC